MITNQKVHQITDSDILDLQLILELLEKGECKFTLPEKLPENSYRPIKPSFSSSYPWYLYFDFNSKEFFFEYILKKKSPNDKNQNRKIVLGDVKFIKKVYNCDSYISEWVYFHRIEKGEKTNTLFVVEGKDKFLNPFDKPTIQTELTRKNLMKIIIDSIAEKILSDSTTSISKNSFIDAQFTTKNLTPKEVGKIFPGIVKELSNLRFGKIYHLLGRQVFINEEFFVKGYLNQSEKDKIKALNKIKQKNVIREIGLKKIESAFLIQNHKSEFEEFIRQLREE